jgi:hypothetical protein
VSFAAITLCIASQPVFIVVAAYFVIDCPETFGYTIAGQQKPSRIATNAWNRNQKLQKRFRNKILCLLLERRLKIPSFLGQFYP